MDENTNRDDISLVEQELFEKAQEVQAIENDILALEESCALARQAEETLREVREFEERLAASSPCNNNIHQSQPNHEHQNDNNILTVDGSHLQQPQQDGWRITLYEQNMEGNWDVLGTGVLTHNYARPSPEAAMLLTPENVFSILGQPMLCVQNWGGITLLRSRVLLHDSAYKREGSSPMITWQEGTEKVRSILVSFLDEAGCDDTLDFIKHIQVRARWILESISRLGDGKADTDTESTIQAEQQQNSHIDDDSLHIDDYENRVDGSDNQHLLTEHRDKKDDNTEKQVPEDKLGLSLQRVPNESVSNEQENEMPEQEDVSEMLTKQHQSDNVSQSPDSNLGTDLDKEVSHAQGEADEAAGAALSLEVHSSSSEDNTKQQSPSITRSVTFDNEDLKQSSTEGNVENYDSDEQDTDNYDSEEESGDIEELESEVVFDNSAKASSRDSSFTTQERDSLPAANKDIEPTETPKDSVSSDSEESLSKSPKEEPQDTEREDPSHTPKEPLPSSSIDESDLESNVDYTGGGDNHLPTECSSPLPHEAGNSQPHPDNGDEMVEEYKDVETTVPKRVSLDPQDLNLGQDREKMQEEDFSSKENLPPNGTGSSDHESRQRPFPISSGDKGQIKRRRLVKGSKLSPISSILNAPSRFAKKKPPSSLPSLAQENETSVWQSSMTTKSNKNSSKNRRRKPAREMGRPGLSTTRSSKGIKKYRGRRAKKHRSIHHKHKDSRKRSEDMDSSHQSKDDGPTLDDAKCLEDESNVSQQSDIESKGESMIAVKDYDMHQQNDTTDLLFTDSHDETLFKQPLLLDDCPICFVPLPFLGTGRKYKACCGKEICSGCIIAMNDARYDECPFCRMQAPSTEEETIKRNKYRMSRYNDAMAIDCLGCFHYNGECGLPQDYEKAFELWHLAGKLGYQESYYNIGHAYHNGEGVAKDEEKAKKYYESSAIGGDIEARYELGSLEKETESGSTKRALKHFMIAAAAGDAYSLEEVKEYMEKGIATTADYDEACQIREQYLNRIRTEKRDEAAAVDEKEYKYF